LYLKGFLFGGKTIVGGLRPAVASDSYVTEGVPISTAFVFATMYLWGFAPAILLQAAAVLTSEILQRKEIWKVLFNVGQYVISVAAAWLVLYLSGVATSPGDMPESFLPPDVAWVVPAWVRYPPVTPAPVASTPTLEALGGLWENGGQ